VSVSINTDWSENRGNSDSDAEVAFLDLAIDRSDTLSRLNFASLCKRELPEVARDATRGEIHRACLGDQYAQTMQQRVELAPAGQVIFSQGSTGSPGEAARRIDLACCRQRLKARQEDVGQCG
jgi:hypothetical protein